MRELICVVFVLVPPVIAAENDDSLGKRKKKSRTWHVRRLSITIHIGLVSLPDLNLYHFAHNEILKAWLIQSIFLSISCVEVTSGSVRILAPPKFTLRQDMSGRMAVSSCVCLKILRFDMALSLFETERLSLIVVFEINIICSLCIAVNSLSFLDFALYKPELCCQEIQLFI